MKKRLLIITTSPETIYLILKGQPTFLNQYFEVILCTSSGDHFDDVKQTESAPIYVVDMARKISFIKDLSSLWNLTRLILKIKPDIVHSYTPKAGFISMLAAFFCRVPVRIHTFTGLLWPTAKGFKRYFLSILDRIICGCATHVVPESIGVRNDLIDNKITNKKLPIIGNGNIAGIDTNFFSPKINKIIDDSIKLRNQLNLPVTDFIFLYIGRIHPDKGIKELISAFNRLQMPNVHLLIVGGIDKSIPLQVDIINLINNSANVRWIGFADDVRPTLIIADVFVLASHREGFPNVILQASAMARPIISTNVSGANEIVISNKNGWLVPICDIDSLFSAMKEAVNTPRSRLDEMGEISKKIILEKYDRKYYLGSLLDFYNSLV